MKILAVSGSLREILTTMSANLVEEACLALPLRGTGIREDGSVESADYSRQIRQALSALAARVSRP